MDDFNCECEGCQFRNVAFSTLAGEQVSDLCKFRQEYVYQKGI